MTQIQRGLSLLLCSLALTGCTVYSPRWTSHVGGLPGPPLASGTPTFAVSRCPVVSVTLSGSYNCIDTGFRTAAGEVVRSQFLRKQLKESGARIQHFTTGPKKSLPPSVRYELHLVALEPTVYVGVPRLPGQAYRSCQDYWCIKGSWEGGSLGVTLVWPDRPPVQPGSFWFSPEMQGGSQDLPGEGTPLRVTLRDQAYTFTSNTGSWSLVKERP